MDRAALGLLPRTARAYASAFNLFMAFTVYMDLSVPWQEVAVVAFLEFLVRSSLSAASLQNYLSALRHYFEMYNWSVTALQARRTLLLVKSVKIHNPLKPKIKGILSVGMLKDLISMLGSMPNAVVYQSICLLAFFGFFRLASLVPVTSNMFDRTRHPVVQDVIFTSKGLQIIQKCAKTMQFASQYRIVHIPKLSVVDICPVKSLKTMICIQKLTDSDPLFVIGSGGTKIPVTTFKVRATLSKALVKMGLEPKDYGFHCFRRSGACLALELKVPLKNIKIHGHWRSDAVWAYLRKTPKAAAVVADTFQNNLH